MTHAQRANMALRKVPSWLVYLVGALIPVWYFWLALSGQMGVEPINTLERALGVLAMQALVVVLAVTPLRKWTGVSLVMHRRALGLLAFFYVVCHLLAWVVLDIGDLSRAWSDILKRPYITIGMAAFVLLLPVAITSNNRSIRKMGPVRWRRLHMLTYVICVLGAVHYIMVQKVWEVEPVIYLAIILALLATRIPTLRREFATS
ncbi:Sulfoxide reductase heme-binding subunit YedZ [Rhodobacteraceae bacterium THAF1]|uniref:protein-methionine-sulfoxide reductase heme-binding subunit MsrQ n=1 Tax=Palleronia sp. THAF1 TaxID=2587842 RepID=UPI000F405B2F|nr:protein-methionine-sulfoxide reductase heme-binding subunit MsrQ [Palleronia sp. THAF1]QFU07159.1 Sulfoxide reductase heme-binding subunit YedZ [Palleronia sp. THAF1]VDC16686.1 Sulfoxide reductase heme-binding subunit YedZ [Rhodobacteraceae bacterium THAF1]